MRCSLNTPTQTTAVYNSVRWLLIQRGSQHAPT
jgi:hypothetical protein